jgi:hypothetical protein
VEAADHTVAAVGAAGITDKSRHREIIYNKRVSNLEMEKRSMRRTHRKLDGFHGTAKLKIAVLAVVVSAASFPIVSRAQQPSQKTYGSADEAGKALIAAVDKNDEKAMLEVLGQDGKQIVSSGDPAEDKENRSNFCQRYQVMHRLVTEPDGTTTLYIGAENWPTPIPIVKKGDHWYFDTDAGKQEILYRRIGKNELSAIHVTRELVAAQKEYFAKFGNEYAQKFVSDEGKRNGLYWPAPDKNSESPIGPLVANAGSDGVVAGAGGSHEPFRGYYFRILEAQGKSADGGAATYVADGKMTKGFAFVAYPAVYRDSGVMTFIVGQDGVAYEKDLGKASASRAKTMKTYDPDATWKKAEEPEQSADNQKRE